MFVKMYQYHIQKDKVHRYLEIQEKAAELYRQYLQFHTLYLNSKEDETKWIEITSYKDEDEYSKGMKLLSEQKEIHDLFEEFKTLLVTDKEEITEEDFVLKKCL